MKLKTMSGLRTPNAVDLHVGNRLRLRRKELRLSQAALGDKLGVTFQQVQKYEHGTNRVGASRLWDAAQTLGVPVGYFFLGLEGGKADSNVRETSAVAQLVNSPDGYKFAEALGGIKQGEVRRQLLEMMRLVASIGRLN